MTPCYALYFSQITYTGIPIYILLISAMRTVNLLADQTCRDISLYNIRPMVAPKYSHFIKIYFSAYCVLSLNTLFKVSLCTQFYDFIAPMLLRLFINQEAIAKTIPSTITLRSYSYYYFHSLRWTLLLLLLIWMENLGTISTTTTHSRYCQH